MRNLVVGCAQVGQKYGVNNHSKPIDKDELTRMVQLCVEHGIDEYDTAPRYGESQKILGLVVDKLKIKNQVKITSKIEFLSADCSYKSFENRVVETLDELHVERLENLFLHNVDEFDYLDKKIEFLERLKEKHLIVNYGLSVYEIKDLQYYKKHTSLSSIQCPANLCDHRFIEALNEDQYKNLIVYYRSIFLQGLILKNHKDLIDSHPTISRYLNNIEKKLSRAQYSIKELFLFYMFSLCDFQRKILVGIDCFSQLKNIIDIIKMMPEKMNFNEYEEMSSIINFNETDPRTWKMVN